MGRFGLDLAGKYALALASKPKDFAQYLNG
jgi:hypothetical protein